MPLRMLPKRRLAKDDATKKARDCRRSFGWPPTMPRRRKNEPSILEIAIKSRWPVSAFLSAASLIVGLWIVPAVLRSTPAFRPLAGVIRMLAWLPILGFGLIALVKWLQEANLRAKADGDGRPPSQTRSVSSGQMLRQRVGPLTSGVTRARAEPSLHVVISDRVETRSATTPWSMELLQSIEWKRFEQVVAAYFREKNFRCETIAYGADDGVDGRLYFGDLPTPVGIIQCKAWVSRPVGVAPVRELLGVMAHEKVARGYFCATGSFTQEATAFAASNPIKPIGGKDFLDAIEKMTPVAQQRLLELCTTGDYKTPTCASCGIKLVQKTIGRRQAWACRNYPRCKMKIWIRSDRTTAFASVAREERSL